jgi:two-component system NtrC family sensor kinase
MFGEQSARILVVEDEVVVARDMQSQLEHLGYEVLPSAATKTEAIKIVAATGPDLVLMDIHLDELTGGIGAAGEIASRFSVPVVFTAAYRDQQTIARAKIAAPYGYLLKPIRSDELRIAIELALHKHHMHKDLRARELWFSIALRSIADAVITVDPDCKVTFVNPAAELLTGVSAAHAIGCSVKDVLKISVDGNPTHPFESVLAERQLVEMPFGTLTNLLNGDERYISDSAAAVVVDGELLGAVMVFRDVTEQRELQEQVYMSDHLRSVGMLAAGIAHEVNNPLTVISANVELLSLSLGAGTLGSAVSSETLNNALSDMAEASRRIRDVVSDLKVSSSPDLLEAANIDVAQVLTRSMRMARSDARNRATFDCDFAPAPLVWGSEARLGRVVINLLSNASQAIVCGDPREQSIRMSLRTSDKGEAVFEVEDSGIGMSKATLRRLFTPFFTTKELGKGTGLGLFLSQRIVAAMGGSIKVTSEVGHGTRVTVTLPPSEHEGAQRPKASARKLDHQRSRVLIIDDDAAVLRTFQRLLEGECDVTTTLDARVALEMFQAGSSFDTILCDLMMPEMNGMEFHERLAKLRPAQAQRVVFVTGGSLSAHATEFMARCEVKCLEKPVSLQTLQAAIRQPGVH